MKLVIVSFVLIFGMLASPLKALAQFENIDYNKGNEIRVILDGRQLDFDVAPQLIKGRVLVPMRKTFESFGLKVSWDASLREARGSNDLADIVFPIGSTKARINGQVTSLDVPAQIIRGNTMLPLRFLSEHMGYNIVWNSKSQLILLSQSTITEWRYGGFESVKSYKEFEVEYINGVKTKEFRYTGRNHPVKLIDLYKKDGSLIPNVPDFKVKEYVATWSQKSSFTGKTYWVHMDQITKAIQANPIYLEQGLQPLNTGQIQATAEVGDYVKIRVDEHYFDLDTWKTVMGTNSSELNAVIDEDTLDQTVISPSDTLFKVQINDQYSTVMGFDTLNKAVFNTGTDKLYTVLNQSPASLFKWDAQTWKRLDENLPWTGMTQDMLLVQLRKNPDKKTKETTKFNTIELWIYTGDQGDAVYYFEDGVLTNIL